MGAHMTGPEAYEKAVEHANLAARTSQTPHDAAIRHAAIAQAYAAIAQAEATARASAKSGHYPGGGWVKITHPDPADA